MSTERPTLFHRDVDGFGRVTVRALDPDADVDLVHDWVNRDRARFWGMVGADRDRVREVYTYVDSLPTHHAYLLHRDGVPVGLFQSYDPAADPVGECYPVRRGDVGVHLMVGPPDGGAEPGFTAAVLSTFLAFVLVDPARRRVVAEPDARNGRAVARLVRTGFVPGPLVDLPDKRARLLFLDRETFERR